MPEPVHPQLGRVPHGGPGAQPFGGLDFSVNTNPLGPNPALLRAVLEADHAHYPDPHYHAPRESLARWHGTEAACVVPAAGASELLHRLARAYLRPGDAVLSVLAPFGEFARAAQLQGGRLEVARPEGAASAVRPGVRLVYLGHPHNPTGHHLGPDGLEALHLACREADALLILDLAYAPFVGLPCPPASDHLVLLHSPGKAHGLVGARPAYALASPPVAAALHNLAPAWAVPAGTAALLEALPEAQTFLHATLPQVAGYAAELVRNLARTFEVGHHGTPYLTVQVADAAGVSARLLSQGVRVRDCASYGLPGTLRVSARLPDENARLVRVLEELHV